MSLHDVIEVTNDNKIVDNNSLEIFFIENKLEIKDTINV